ncbi:MAG: RNA-directed DNA polymerase [Clostridia bacterium]
MNSRERHENRYKRRVAKRKSKMPTECDDFDKVFNLDNMYRSYQKCRLGVGWKASTQKYMVNAIYNITKTLKELKTSTYKTGNFYEFNICERGKQRHIRSIHISERIVQKCLCDNSLVKLLSRSFIQDNGACQKGKGEHYALNRLEKHLRTYYKTYGTNKVYILNYDFSKYFDNINHEKLKELLLSKYTDKKLITLIFNLIDDFGEKGLGLGSQISQICALAYPNKLDHNIKEVIIVRGYGRYMDDGYLISKDKEKLNYCLKRIKQICDGLGIILNQKKTHIRKIDKKFQFLKKRFIFTETGKIIRLPAKDTATRMRRKLKKFKIRLDAGKMKLGDIKKSMSSWLGSMKHCRSHKQVAEMKKLYKKLFLEEYV